MAQIEGVVVLNVNELAQALRPQRLPGERVELKITQLGQDRTQGVGYLEDGTMVVVEKAGGMVGQRIQVEFSRMLQTQAGKMMFAVLPAHSPMPAAAVAPEQPRPQPPRRNEPQKPEVHHQPQTPQPQAGQQPAPRRAYHARRRRTHHKPASAGQPPVE